MTNNGKVLNVIPNDSALFQLIIMAKGDKSFLLFKLDPILNEHVKTKKKNDGLYNFIDNQEIFKWLFFTYKRHISATSWAYLLNNYPEVIEKTFGVIVLPHKNVSYKLWASYFTRRYIGKYQELFPTELPQEAEDCSAYYDVQATIDGRVLNTSEIFRVLKSDYHAFKKRYGEEVPYVIFNPSLKVS